MRTINYTLWLEDIAPHIIGITESSAINDISLLSEVTIKVFHHKKTL